MNNAFEHLPRNPAADNNKQFIFEALNRLDLLSQNVLEIGSGPGQHGIHFCQLDSLLMWQPTEIKSKLPLTNDWYQVAQKEGISNYLCPLAFHIGTDPLPEVNFDLIYSANVLHIISESLAKHLALQLSVNLQCGQKFVCYGPFKREGKFTTESNELFNQWLLSEGYGGIQDLVDIPIWTNNQLKLIHHEDMPANNFLVIYEKQ